jgi:GAF domain-containing protein
LLVSSLPSAAPVPRNETDRLIALRSYDILDTPPESVFDNLVWLAAQCTACPISTLTLVDGTRQWFKARQGVGALRCTPRDAAGFCAHAILAPDRPLIVPDATLDPRFAANPLVAGAAGIRFYAGVPLVDADSHALGALCVVDIVARDLREEELASLTKLAEAAMTALELRRMRRIAFQLARHHAALVPSDH